MQLRALDILRHIGSISHETEVRCQDDGLQVGDKTVCIDSTQYSPAGYEDRVQRLLRTHDVASVNLSVLERNWREALRKGPVKVSTLLSLAKEASSTPYGIEDALHEWRQRIKQQLSQLDCFCTEKFPPGDPKGLGKDHVELKTLLYDWPEEVLTGKYFAFTESPFENFPPMPIDSIWVDLDFVDLNETPSEMLKDFLKEAAEKRYHTQQGSSFPADFVLDKLDGLVAMVGDPGVGKSTLLKWMARKFIKNAQGRYLLPLFVPLRKYAQSKFKGDLLRYALKECGVRTESQQKLWATALGKLAGEKRENVVLLFDGLDEIPSDSQASVIEEIDGLSHTFTTIVSSRPSGYPTRLATSAMYEIAELAPESIHTLKQQWFEHTGQPQDRADLLQTHLDSHPEIRRLARNPFLLTILCGVCCSLDAKGEPLPSTRASLCERTLELMASNTNDGKDYVTQEGDMPSTEKLAFRLFAEVPNAPQYVFDSADVRKLSESDHLLKEILEPRRLVRQWDLHNETLYFTHTTFHEFFVARYLGNQNSGFQDKRIEQHLCDADWQEVFGFLAVKFRDKGNGFWKHFRELANNPDRFGVVHVRLSRMLGEAQVRDGGQRLLGIDLREKLWKRIVECSEPGAYAEALVELDPQWLIHRYEKETTLPTKCRENLMRSLRRVQAMQASDIFVGELLGSDASALKASYAAKWLSAEGKARLRDKLSGNKLDLAQQTRLLRALGVSKDAQAIDIAFELAQKETALSDVALEALAGIGGQTAFDRLEHCFSQQNNPALRTAACRALGLMNDLRARNLLLQSLAMLDVNTPFAARVLKALAEFPISSGSGMIADYLRLSDDPSIRRDAAGVLEHSTEMGVGEFLATAAREDTNFDVRYSALAALGIHGRVSDKKWLTVLFGDRKEESELRVLAFDALVNLAVQNPTLYAHELYPVGTDNPCGTPCCLNRFKRFEGPKFGHTLTASRPTAASVARWAMFA